MTYKHRGQGRNLLLEKGIHVNIAQRNEQVEKNTKLWTELKPLKLSHFLGGLIPLELAKGPAFTCLGQVA